MSYPPELILNNTRQVQQRIERAALSVGRDPADVSLVVVTKGHPVEAVQAAMQAGLGVFGENYVEEGLAKIQAINDPGVAWHMIGHVQSRKAALVSEHFQMVHSVDSFKLAQRLDRFAAQFGRRLPILLECNVSGEESKFGFTAGDEAAWPDLAQQIAPLLELEHLEVRGLMTMAPFFDQPELARPVFGRLKRLGEILAQRLPQVSWKELSMGMSGDYEAAVQEGATLVRVGTAIMGVRLVVAEN